ncbi:MAG: Ig-like domain-containing protein [Patescibacteria group bacterium]
MKKIAKLPTILGVLILLVGVITGVFLINSKQIFKLSANIDALPKNVRLANITDSSFTVTWTTDIESNGFIKWGKGEFSLSKVALEEGTDKSFVHSVNIMGADSNSSVLFKINSNGNDYDNEGIPWQTKTLSAKNSSGTSLIASGTILKSDASTPAKALVYLTINGSVLSTLTSDEGNYVIPISIYISNITDNTAIEISVQGGLLGSSQSVIYPQTIRSIPAMILGRTYDFRSLPQTDDSSLPESNLTVPESIEISSRFEITKTNETQTTENIKIDSIDEGEIITTTNPEFFGTAPKNSELEIVVESEMQTDTLKTTSTGKWSWSPPNNLEPGEHKLTIKWRDTTGVLRTVTRSFVVSASEGPAFESTPSATPISSPSATATSSATAPPASTSASLGGPTPETGSLTATLGLFIMGIGVLMSSIFIWKKAYA